MGQPSWSLGKDEVHLWTISLARSEVELARLRELLTAEEYARACCYRPRQARDQFIASRGLLRLVLAGYLAIDPARVRFRTEQTSKPYLAGGGPHFNVSHSGEIGLIAVTNWGEIGVDVERVRAMPTHLDMAQRYFAPGEVQALTRLPPGAREQAFFHIWTRKEAFVKAIGVGLAHGLERFEVSVPPDDPARLLHIDGDRAKAETWSMTSFEPAAGYVGALAVQTHGLKIVPRQFEE